MLRDRKLHHKCNTEGGCPRLLERTITRSNQNRYFKGTASGLHYNTGCVCVWSLNVLDNNTVLQTDWWLLVTDENKKEGM